MALPANACRARRLLSLYEPGALALLRTRRLPHRLYLRSSKIYVDHARDVRTRSLGCRLDLRLVSLLNRCIFLRLPGFAIAPARQISPAILNVSSLARAKFP